MLGTFVVSILHIFANHDKIMPGSAGLTLALFYVIRRRLSYEVRFYICD